MSRFAVCIALSGGLAVLGTVAGEASNYSLKSSVVASGGTSAAASSVYSAGVSVGQAAIGDAASPDHRAWIGFWVDPVERASSGVPGPESQLPKCLVLSPNVPNPFRGQTLIAYGVPRAAYVALAVYDVRGRLIKTLHDSWTEGGYYMVVWNGRGEGGRTVSPGLYFCRLSNGSTTRVSKTLLLE